MTNLTLQNDTKNASQEDDDGVVFSASAESLNINVPGMKTIESRGQQFAADTMHEYVAKANLANS